MSHYILEKLPATTTAKLSGTFQENWYFGAKSLVLGEKQVNALRQIKGQNIWRGYKALHPFAIPGEANHRLMSIEFDVPDLEHGARVDIWSTDPPGDTVWALLYINAEVHLCDHGGNKPEDNVWQNTAAELLRLIMPHWKWFCCYNHL